MARTELPNGVILPAEYSDDWYEDMTSNLTKLDDVIGSDSEKLNADGVYFLRMSSAALTDSGTGNFSDLNSSYKIKTGDLVLDSGRKLYRIVSVDSTNETFTVGTSLFKVTAESDLAHVAESGDYDDLDNKPDLKPVATSGDYDDLDNKPDLKPVATSGDYDDLTDLPTYGITRYCSSAITDNSTVAFSAISSTDKIKVGDFLLDINGKLYQISSVDSVNETVSVTTPLTQLAVDSGVMHLSGNETADGLKTFSKYITSDGSVAGDEYSSNTRTNLWLMSNRDTEEVSGVLFDSYRQNTAQGTGIHILGISIKENSVRYEGCRWGWYWNNILNGYTFDFKPTTQGANQAVKHNLGTSTDKWSEVHAITYYYGSSDTEFSDKFVTTDTAQTISGNKTFSDGIGFNSWLYFTNSSVTKGTIPQSTVNPYRIYFGSGVNYANSLFNIDTTVSSTGVQILTLRSAENVVNGDDTRFVIVYDPNLTQPRYIGFKGDCLPSANNTYECGSNSFKWKSFNGINPGSLSMPDFNNGLDISGYITLNSDSSYTPLSDGYIYICCYSSSACGLWVRDSNNNGVSTRSIESVPTYNNLVSIYIPVVKNVSISIFTPGCENILTAKFFPCLGNV